jgi:hypothetical protein
VSWVGACALAVAALLWLWAGRRLARAIMLNEEAKKCLEEARGFHSEAIAVMQEKRPYVRAFRVFFGSGRG